MKIESGPGNFRANDDPQFPKNDGGYKSGCIEKVCTLLSNILFKFSIAWHSKAKDAREQMVRRFLSIFVIIGGIIALSYGQGYLDRATLDNYDVQHS